MVVTRIGRIPAKAGRSISHSYIQQMCETETKPHQNLLCLSSKTDMSPVVQKTCETGHAPVGRYESHAPFGKCFARGPAKGSLSPEIAICRRWRIVDRGRSATGDRLQNSWDFFCAGTRSIAAQSLVNKICLSPSFLTLPKFHPSSARNAQP